MIRTYSELKKLKTFDERFNYLVLSGVVGETTFGFNRIFNQMFYTSKEWLQVKNFVIVRDGHCDLGIKDREIPSSSRVYIHHMNPITVIDIQKHTENLLNPNFLICTSFETHNAIHYGDKSYLNNTELVERMPNDTCPWKEKRND